MVRKLRNLKVAVCSHSDAAHECERRYLHHLHTNVKCFDDLLLSIDVKKTFKYK